jgi:hypothetical protein
MWDGQLIWDVADIYDMPRGDIQSLMVSSASQASNIKTFCQVYCLAHDFKLIKNINFPGIRRLSLVFPFSAL